MADTYTATLNLTKPEVGASRDTWGQKYNANMDAIDTAVKAASDAGSAALAKAVAKTGDSMSGSLTMTGDLGGYTPGIKFAGANISDFFVRGVGGNRLQFCDQGMSVEYFSIGADGSVSTRQFGDLNARIEARAAALADDRANYRYHSMRMPFAGDLYNSWNLNGGMAEPYGGAFISSRATIADGTANGAWIPGIFRWRYLQMYANSQGWVQCGYA